MREIKFKLVKDNILQGIVELKPGGIIDVAYEWNTAYQFTGLLDKTGKEIYEGDIIKNHNRTTHFSDEDYSFIFKVTYGVTKERVGFNLKRKQQRWYEIIGNIYENLELLKC